MGNKCIGEVDIFAAKDGIYVSDPSCYVVGSDVVKYSKKSTTIDGVTTVTYIDEAGVETASLPVGAEQIDCSRVVFVGNSTGGDSTIPTVQDCDGNDAVHVYDPCAITAINTAKDAIVAAINGRPDYTAQLTSIGDTLTAMKSDTAAINTGVASSLVLLQAIVDKPNPTPVDLQPVLDKLDELIALDTAENSTLVDVKNQLIAANVTLSNAETLLTHIDADMHDVVAKLQVALDLLASLQTLLTTIDGRIAAIQTAITTADANNVSALNDIKTELQAINVNTDTLEALITAGNVLLTAIASNTDGVEGLLTEIRDLPVTDSWFLLYDMGKEAPETTTSLGAWSTTGGVTAVGDSLTVTSDGTATVTVMLPKPATPKYLGFTWLGASNGVSIFVNGGLVPNPADALFYTDPDGEATIEFVFSGFVGEILYLITYNNDGSIGGCKPFIRRIVDNVVTDTKLDLTTPYTVGGEVRTSCPDAQCTCIVLSLVDYVAEHTAGGGIVQKTPAWADGNGWQFVPVSGTPITSWDRGWGYTDGTDANTSFKVVTQISVESGKSYNITNSINDTQRAFYYIIDGVEYPIDYFYETKTWVATTTGSVEFGVVVGTSAVSGSFNDFSVTTLEGKTVVPATCTNFVRKIVDGVVTDTDLDGQPYTVVGEVRTSCPAAQAGCTCTDELQAVKTSVIEHLPLVECDVETSPAVDGQQLFAFSNPVSFASESGWSVNFAPGPTLPYSKSNTIDNYLTLVYSTAAPIPAGCFLQFNTTTPLSGISVGFDSGAFTNPTLRQATVPNSVTAGVAQQVALPTPLSGDSQTIFVVRVASSQVGQISGVSIWSPDTEAVIDTTTAVLTALDACSVERIKDALTDLPVSVAPLEQPTHTPVSVTSGSYTLAAGVKSYSITFVDKGEISGAYRPAGYSTNADYVEQGYATALTVTGTSFIIEEVR